MRDGLLGRLPKDFDVATNATPETVRHIFGKRRTLAFGASFGVIGVLPEWRDGRENAEPTEVATFRSDGEYSDGRRPDSVHYGNAEQDALRRDFTINGLFYDPAQDQVIDFVGGQDDLKNGLLRTIGDAEQRFEEDKLRMLRAVRFATVLGLTVTDETKRFVIQHADSISVVSGERIGAEMRRVVSHPRAADGIRHLNEMKLAAYVWPEMVGADTDRLRHYLSGLGKRSFSDCLACSMIALGLPPESLGKLTRHWKLSNEESRRVKASLNHWRVLAQADQLKWSEVQPALIDRDIDGIFNVASAIVSGDGGSRDGIRLAETALQWPPEKLNPRALLTGDDLKRSGFQSGPAFAKILRATREAQLNGDITSFEEALAMAKQMVE